MSGGRGLAFGPLRRKDSTQQIRFDRQEGGNARCPDCNAAAISAAGVRNHKIRGGCVIIPGARARAAAVIAEYILAGAA